MYYFYESEETLLFKTNKYIAIGALEKRTRYYIVVANLSKDTALCKFGLISTVDYGIMRIKYKIVQQNKFKYVHLRKIPDKKDFITALENHAFSPELSLDKNCLSIVSVWPGNDVYYSITNLPRVSSRIEREFLQALNQGRITKSLIDELKIK